MAFNQEEVGAGKVVNVYNTGNDEAPLKFKAGQTDITGDMKAQMSAGLAELDENGKVKASQLPSYVDDVVEGYYYNSAFYEDAAHTTQMTAEKGKIYIDIPTGNNYRWSGTQYVEFSSKDVLCVKIQDYMGMVQADHTPAEAISAVNDGKFVYLRMYTGYGYTNPGAVYLLQSVENISLDDGITMVFANHSLSALVGQGRTTLSNGTWKAAYNSPTWTRSHLSASIISPPYVDGTYALKVSDGGNKFEWVPITV